MAVAESGSFRMAAQTLNRSQSAVSMQVQKLEEQLNLQLFHRTTRMVRLTHQGDILLTYAKRAIYEINAGLNEIKKISEGSSGQISIASVPSIASSVLPRVLSGFKRQNPDIYLNVREQLADDLLQSVRNLEVDFAIGTLMPESKDLMFSPIVAEDIVAVASNSAGLGRRETVTLEQVASRAIILISPTASLRSYIDRALAERGLSIQESFEVTNVRTMFDFALAGLGTALMPACSVPQVIPEDMNVYKVEKPGLKRMICQIKLKGTSFAPLASTLLAAIKKEMLSDLRFHPPT